MAMTMRDGIRLHWRLEGAADRPVLVLLNSIGTDMSLWDRTVPLLLSAFRLLRIDTRGAGGSDAPEGDYSLSMLADDVVAILDDVGVERAAVAGVSLGGMVAMQLALDHPARVSALALICTSATMDPAAWQSRIDTVRAQGTAAIADMAVGRFLSPGFVKHHPEVAASLRDGIVRQADAGYAGAGAAIRDMALAHRIATITQPTLVVTATLDISTPYAGHGEHLLSIAGARHVGVDGAHLPPIEAPGALAAALRTFLCGDAAANTAADTLFEAGLRNRRRVLGDAWVDTSLAKRTPFTADFQAMITRIAWAEIWGRPGLDDRTRRLLVLAITCALGRWEEFALHVRAGLREGGFTTDELKEVLMQTAIYAGVPAANTGFAEAQKIIAMLEQDA
ncbi:3-oxoadipate enol-lactonase [Sphingomonas carotinifaciens]|uniref:3-oxoadipate enol-lactonase n=1 Tax=Sphingomonas carotinifaciens TaxID=1166323 RepID=A0A1G7LXD8_9SPHN|nr:3-oxoadipate enol-lactonase [Sphingomonas carotinifaciens]MBB4086995.1 3-oxoadipate enol-lactonase/4-carboxymuconolactone decarboxylase [Sphingomonas carotinifaciens]MWC42186.1 3-oxoadipate enol-lactonase [Sphingomonas carotinifaciens]SDF54103.1 3-oxoadipate enol-lactonase / 4-carboxymuconolactone decarboxylase [Sphingomonas carotinifaciens]